MSRFDRAWFGSWIQPQHLRPEAIRARRRAFAAHPARLLTLPRFLRADLAGRLNRFLEREADYRPIRGLYSRDLEEVPDGDWNRAAPADRFCRFSVLTSVKPPFRLGENVVSFLKIRRAFEDARSPAFFERLTGLRLGRADLHAHAMGGGDYLKPHADAVEGRRLAYVLFLTRGWDSSWGGVLTIVGAGGRTWRIAPQFNCLAVFDLAAGTEHEVSPIAPGPARALRLTIAGWVHGPDPA